MAITYYRAPVKNGEIKTGMYCTSDAAQTIEIARALRGPWEDQGWATKYDHTAIVMRNDCDGNAYQGISRTIVELIPLDSIAAHNATIQ